MTRHLKVVLKRGKSKPFWLGHPWVFSGAIAKVIGEVGDTGGPCELVDERSNVVGWGQYNPHGAVAVRVLQHRRTTEREARPRPFMDLVQERLSTAVARRAALGMGDDTTTGYRLVNAEGDELTGLIVDRFASTAVVHVNSRAMYEHRVAIAHAVATVAGIERVVVAVNEEASRLEMIPVGTEWVVGEAGPQEFVENGVRYRIEPGQGQKTGFFLDQREQRRHFASTCADKSVLDLYSYVGSFGLNAARAGASSVLAIDSSQPACNLAESNVALNGFAGQMRVECADAMTRLKELIGAERSFERVVCDPPKFARGRKHVTEALKKYARLNTLAMSVLSPGGLLLSCSCSQHISERDFVRMLTESGHRLRRGVVVHHVASQPADHPFLSVAPEGRYLKAALLSLS